MFCVILDVFHLLVQSSKIICIFLHVFSTFFIIFPLRFRTRRLGPFSMESLSREGSEASDADAEGGPEVTIDLQVDKRWFISSPMPPRYLDHPFCRQKKSELIYFSFLDMPFVLLKKFFFFSGIFFSMTAFLEPHEYEQTPLPTPAFRPHPSGSASEPALTGSSSPRRVLASGTFVGSLSPSTILVCGCFFSIKMLFAHLHGFRSQLIINWDAFLCVWSIFQFIIYLLAPVFRLGRKFEH